MTSRKTTERDKLYPKRLSKLRCPRDNRHPHPRTYRLTATRKGAGRPLVACSGCGKTWPSSHPAAARLADTWLPWRKRLDVRRELPQQPPEHASRTDERPPQGAGTPRFDPATRLCSDCGQSAEAHHTRDPRERPRCPEPPASKEDA